ncbi:MAG TPA: hypothetical protein VGO60_05420 [Iamia sp.]|nr:hypothetical protein [Iamia sp.]
MALAVLAGAPAAAGLAVARQRPSAPVSADGLQASDGQRTLRVGQSQGLSPAGQQVGVSGSGYDVSKGIYVAFCVVTPPTTAPSPCGGGIDQTGATGASAWVSSDPPSYGVGLATPYGPGGSFSVTITVAPVIADGFDCRRIQCAIVSRNDHIRTGDRTQDIFVPVTFAAGDAPPPVTPPPGTTPPSTAPPTTIAPPPAPTTTAPAPAPTTEISTDGLTGTAGDRTLTLSAAADLDPETETLTVEGAGFDVTKAVQVTLCRVAASPTEVATPCLAGSSPEASQVVAPDGADGDFAAYDDDGSFAVELEVAAEIDGETDCRRVECAVTVRHFAVADAEAEAAAADRTLDMAVPVVFAAESPAEPTTSTTAPDEEVAATPVRAEDPDGGSSALPVVLALVVLLAGAGVVALVIRSRRASGGPPADGAP